MTIWIIAALASAPVVLHLTDSANHPPEHPNMVMVALVRGWVMLPWPGKLVELVADVR